MALLKRERKMLNSAFADEVKNSIALMELTLTLIYSYISIYIYIYIQY